VFIDYLFTSKKKNLIPEWGLPILLGITCLILSFVYGINSQYYIIEHTFGFVGTLFCFTLASLNMLLGREKMKEASNYKTNIIFRGRKATLYELVIILYAYLILVEGFLCIGYVLAHIFNFVYIKAIAILLNSLYIVLLFNVLITTIRAITETYLILIRDSNLKDNITNK
jgi:hypothetical protein